MIAEKRRYTLICHPALVCQLLRGGHYEVFGIAVKNSQ
jgi:hypothetical protein